MPSYKLQKEKHDRLKAARMITDQLPWFCHEFFENKRDLSGSSKLAYCYALLDFFEFLHENNMYFQNKEITKYEISDLAKLKKADLEEYFTYKEVHEVKNDIVITRPATMKRIKSTLSTFWTYYVQEEKLDVNPLIGIQLQRIKDKDPIELNADEKKRLFDCIQYGTGLTKTEMRCHDQSWERDLAICYIFLHTGMRVSELVGIDMDDVDWVSHSIHIDRKGGKQQEVFFSDKAGEVLQQYVDVRHEKFKPYSTTALFLNKSGERISERSVERMLDKYVSAAIPARRDVISPHKLRSTFACNMLEVTGNLELVSQQLGHSKISTTQIYARSGKAARADVRNLIE